jgi:hypothetical protein
MIGTIQEIPFSALMSKTATLARDPALLAKNHRSMIWQVESERDPFRSPSLSMRASTQARMPRGPALVVAVNLTTLSGLWLRLTNKS